MQLSFRPGDWVIYRKTKFSQQPGPRAAQVRPSPNGDDYTYCVDKFWIVSDVRDDGTIVLTTRRGKTHTLPQRDPGLRRASWWQRLLYRSRFNFAET